MAERRRTMSELYWITVLGKIESLGEVGTVFGALAAFAVTVVSIMAICDEDFEDETKDIIRRCRRIAYIVLGISLMLVMFIPNTKQLYMIYGVGGTMDYLKSNPTARQLPDKCIKAFDVWVSKMTEEDKPKQE